MTGTFRFTGRRRVRKTLGNQRDDAYDMRMRRLSRAAGWLGYGGGYGLFTKIVGRRTIIIDIHNITQQANNAFVTGRLYYLVFNRRYLLCFLVGKKN